MNGSMKTPRWLNLNEVLERVPVSAETVRRARYAGDLPAYKPGKNLLFKATDVEKWIESTRVLPTADPRAV